MTAPATEIPYPRASPDRRPHRSLVRASGTAISANPRTPAVVPSPPAVSVPATSTASSPPTVMPTVTPRPPSATPPESTARLRRWTAATSVVERVTVCSLPGRQEPMTGRRRAALAVTVLLAAAGCGGGDRGEQAPRPTVAAGPSTSSEPPPPPPTCAERTLAGLDLPARAAQLLLVGLPAEDPGGGAAGLAGVPVGGVFLQGRNWADAATVGAAIAQLQAPS